MTMKIFWLALGVALAAAGCATKKPAGHFGTGVNFPAFSGPADLVRSFNRVAGIMWFKKLDGKPVDMTWITPKFREKICLVVTINNHCGGG
jgi:hypothetical protein